MKIRTVLERTYRLLEDKKHWIKGVSWADKSGMYSDPKEACRYCLSGAVFIAGDFTHKNSKKAGRFLAKFSEEVNDNRDFIAFNDAKSTSHEKLLTFLKKAIGRAKRKGV